MNKIPVVYDGDMGGDDLWAIAMMLAHPDKFDVLGISTVFGNVSGDYAFRNIANLLEWLKIKDLPIVQGAELPYDGMRPFGDDAYGSDGVGGYILPESPQKPEAIACADWYADILRKYPDVTVFCTGPATNLAIFAQKYPLESKKIHKIVFMGGGIKPPGANGEVIRLPNGEIRKGNITEYAEFNAYQDPLALNILLRSGIPMVFMAADASQFMVLTPERQQEILALHPEYGRGFHQMLMAVEKLDRSKFGVNGPFIHDPNVISYVLAPDLYDGEFLPHLAFVEATPDNPHRGEALAKGNATPAPTPPLWLNSIRDDQRVFEIMVQSLKAIIDRVDQR